MNIEPFIRRAHHEYNPEPTPWSELYDSKCIHCKEKYDDTRLIVWTRTSDTGQVIWWHGRLRDFDLEPCQVKYDPKTKRRIGKKPETPLPPLYEWHRDNMQNRND